MKGTKEGIKVNSVSIKTLLLGVLMFITIVPLIVHIYSIDNYSDYVIEKDRQDKSEFMQSLLLNYFISKQKDGTIFASDLLVASGNFNEMLARNKTDLEDYFENLLESDFVEKNLIDIIGFMVVDENYKNVGSAGFQSIATETYAEILTAHDKLEGDVRFVADGYYSTATTREPIYILVYPLQSTGYKKKLLVFTSIWASLRGVSQQLEADIEIIGSSGEQYFNEYYIPPGQEEGERIDRSSVEPIEQILPYGINGNDYDYVVARAYVGNQGILAKSADLKNFNILTAILSMIFICAVGAYLLKKSLFKRLADFSSVMENIVEGKPTDDIPESKNDEFDGLSEQLKRIIVHNEERTRIKEQLEIAIKQAEVASVAKSEFLANMSHELRTPLNAIIGFSEILAHENLENYNTDKTKEYAKDILDSGRHLLSIINDILDLSKVEAGKMNFFEEYVDIIEICETSMRVLRQSADAKDISIELVADDNFPLVKADERMMQQIMTNLLSNAVKFSLIGRDIQVCVGYSKNGNILVSVKDNGIGIAEDKIDDIMEPFHQIETSYAKTEVGTGLGLSLVKAFVELHDGTIKVDSKLGAYTVVNIEFPQSRIVNPDEDSFCSLDYKKSASVN